MSIFETCQAQFSGNTSLVLECVSETIEAKEDLRASDLISFLSVIAGSMIFFMQSGFAMLCAGSVRIKNVQNTMLKNLLDACGAALAFFLVGECRYWDNSNAAFIYWSHPDNHPSRYFLGYAFSFGGQNDTTETNFIGGKEFVGVGDSAAFWFFQYTFSATSVTIVAGTLAERCQMAAYLCYSMVLAGIVYPVVGKFAPRDRA